MEVRESVFATIELTNSSSRPICYWGYRAEHAIYSVQYETPAGWKEPEGAWLCGTGLQQYTLEPRTSLRFQAYVAMDRPCRVALDYFDEPKNNRLWRHVPQWIAGRLPWGKGTTVTTHTIDVRMLPGLAREGGKAVRRLPKDFPSLQAAAENGDMEAQFRLAGRFCTGDGTQKNLTGAIIWYDAAATNGHAEAAYNLATIYEHGLGVAEDKSRAVYWYRRASELGHAQANDHIVTLPAQ